MECRLLVGHHLCCSWVERGSGTRPIPLAGIGYTFAVVDTTPPFTTEATRLLQAVCTPTPHKTPIKIHVVSAIVTRPRRAIQCCHQQISGWVIVFSNKAKVARMKEQYPGESIPVTYSLETATWLPQRRDELISRAQVQQTLEPTLY